VPLNFTVPNPDMTTLRISGERVHREGIDAPESMQTCWTVRGIAIIAAKRQPKPFGAE